MTIQVDLYLLESEIRRLAAQFPDRNVACRYVTDDGAEPVCIIGTALFGMGVSLASLVNYDYECGKQCYTFIEGTEWDEFPALVQWRQDNGQTWGQAVLNTDLYGDDLNDGVTVS